MTVEPGMFLLYSDPNMNWLPKLYAVKSVRTLKSGRRKVTLITHHETMHEEATATFPDGEIKPPFTHIPAQQIIDKLKEVSA